MKYSVDDIKHRVMTDDAWTCRALTVLHERQTTDEQRSLAATHRNGRGFSQADAHWLSKMAQALLRYGRLSPRQLETVRYHRNGKPRLAKYAGQLYAVAQARSA